MKKEFNFSLEQLENAYEQGGSERGAAKILSISKTTFRQQYIILQGLCIKCKNILDKEGSQCSICLQESRDKVKESLPKEKTCCQCNSSMTRKETQSNISWAKQNICDPCEKQNKLDFSKTHYENNREVYLKKGKHRKEYQKQYRKSDNGKLIRRASNQKRRAQKVNTTSVNINEYIKDLFNNHNECFYCGTSEDLQIEHVTPLSRGGTHTEDNVVLACKKHNLEKGNKTLEEYFNYLEGKDGSKCVSRSIREI